MSRYFGEKEPAGLKHRAFFAAAAAVAVFFVLAARLWYLQVREADYYRTQAESNRIRTIKAYAPRGIIYDRLGVTLADSRPGFDLYLVPEDVTDWDSTRKALKELAGIDGETIDEKLDNADDRPQFQAVKLKEDLPWEETVKIESYKFELPGVILDVNPKRRYLFGEGTAHLLGYLGEISEKELKETKAGAYANGDLVGKYGMEKSLEKELRGADGGKEIEVDALGRKVRAVNWSAPYPGNDIRTSIDVRTQMAAWAALSGKAGAAVAIEPSTGRVLAIVSAPSFDPNALSHGLEKGEWEALISDPMNILLNRAIQGLYPPASTYKPIHAAAALEEEVITPSTKIFSGPSFTYAGRQYRDWKEAGHGSINVRRAIIESSDTFFYQTGLKLGIDRLARYTREFGFGEKTGIDLLNEKSGVVPSSEWKLKAMKVKWYEGETISAAVGQGYMLATPLQLASAYAAIAAGGVLYAPRIVDEVVNPAGTVVRKTTPRKRGELKISAKTREEVYQGLIGVAEEEGGTASFLKSSRLKIAGKTGTAQVSRLVRRTKNVESIAYELRDHAWFAGFAPYDDPRIAVAVIVEHGGFGASAAAPVAREIFKAYLKGASADDDVRKDPKPLAATASAAAPAPLPPERPAGGPEGTAND